MSFPGEARRHGEVEKRRLHAADGGGAGVGAQVSPFPYLKPARDHSHLSLSSFAFFGHAMRHVESHPEQALNLCPGSGRATRKVVPASTTDALILCPATPTPASPGTQACLLLPGELGAHLWGRRLRRPSWEPLCRALVSLPIPAGPRCYPLEDAKRESGLSLVHRAAPETREMRGLVANGERAPNSPGRGCEPGLPPPRPVFEGPPPDRSVPKWVSPQEK